ncbi:MAG: ribose 5-phosphate isomerase B [Proteobacteria bacterium]|jgi:ribose 5-phosphate isomerase B|nr:ribose 5-phosphate isomerase B [Pseudomonadota bacterium]
MLFSKICIASDHAGYQLKEKIKDFLIKKDVPVIDLGPLASEPVDYPDYAKKLAKRVLLKKSDGGILVCGSGTGMAITANKFKGIRAAQCYSRKSTILSRQHNNANIICLGSRMLKSKEAFNFINYFFNTKFQGGRHQKRLNKI